MDKGYYLISVFNFTIVLSAVAIHNKNGQGLLQVDKYVDTIKETGIKYISWSIAWQILKTEFPESYFEVVREQATIRVVTLVHFYCGLRLYLLYLDGF